MNVWLIQFLIITIDSLLDENLVDTILDEFRFDEQMDG
jgi:hypothetical protein